MNTLGSREAPHFAGISGSAPHDGSLLMQVSSSETTVGQMGFL